MINVTNTVDSFRENANKDKGTKMEKIKMMYRT
jgi:hypothetical protein